MLGHTPDELFMPSGLMSWWPDQHAVQWASIFVSQTRELLVVLWFFAAIGFGGRWSLLLAGLLFFVHYGLFKAASGTTHTWHLTLFTLLILGIFSRPGNFTVDGLLSRYFHNYPFPVKPGGIWEGFGIKLVMCCTAYVLFAGGIAKLRYGGMDWLSGETLSHFLKEMPMIKGKIGQSLYGVLESHPFMFRMLSVWTVALELSAPFILFFPRFRWPFVLNAWAFHIGIYLLMLPRYFPQMTVYLLFLNLPGFAGEFQKNKEAPHLQKISRISTWLAAGLISFLLLVFTWTMVAAREPYPLTHVPMYSNRMTDEYIGDFQKSSLRTLKSYQSAAIQYIQSEQPWFLYVYTGNMFNVEVWNGYEWEQLGKSFYEGNINRHLWYHRLTWAFCSDMQYQYAHEFKPTFLNTTKIFQAVARQRNGLLNQRLQYRLMWTGDDGPVEIAKFMP